MRSILFTTAAAMFLASTATGSFAESGETAVLESRAALAELWGRGEPEQTRSETTVQVTTMHRRPEPQVHIAVPENAWADNYAAGRVHEPAGHE